MYSYEEWNKPIQELIKLMHNEYPNGFELRINGFGAELVNNQMVHTYMNDEIAKEYYNGINFSMEEIINNLKDIGH